MEPNLCPAWRAYGALAACVLAILLNGAPAEAGSFSTSASIVDTGGCVNQTAGGSGVTSAGINYGPFPLYACAGTNYSIWAGATAESNGLLSSLVEYDGSVTSPVTMTATSTLTDTLAFSCTSSCGNATLTGTLDGTGVEPNSYSEFMATVVDTTQNITYTEIAEFCPSPPSANCTATGAAATNPFLANLIFPITPGDSYSVTVSVIASLEFSPGEFPQVLANMNDPLTLYLNPGVSATSASGDFPIAPEPSSWLLAGGGLLAMIGTAKRLLAGK
jgi:hypothetical protein